MFDRTRRYLFPGFLLAAGLFASVGLRLHAARNGPPASQEAPTTAAEWLRHATRLQSEKRLDEAERACRTGLLVEPWNAGLCLRLTQVLLERGDGEDLKDWMDELVLGDARIAEQTFQIPEFAVWLQEPAFNDLYREARFQARD